MQPAQADVWTTVRVSVPARSALHERSQVHEAHSFPFTLRDLWFPPWHTLRPSAPINAPRSRIGGEFPDCTPFQGLRWQRAPAGPFASVSFGLVSVPRRWTRAGRRETLRSDRFVVANQDRVGAGYLRGAFALKPRTPSIGFIVNDLAGDYQRRILDGLLAAAEERGVRIVSLVGGPFGARDGAAHQAQLYSCVSQEQLDGLVLVTGVLSGQVRPTALAGFVAGFGPLPLCSVGVALPAFPSITVDNAAGGRLAFRHLVERGRRRIAFLRGPKNNPEAEARFEVYKRMLVESHLPLDLDLVTEGEFDAASGRRAIATLLDERHAAFDAVMGANDLLALGAMNALLERNVAIPQRVSIIGFDDIEAARFATAPLTTVRQPLAAMGRAALESVLQQLSTPGVVSNQTLPAELVVRESTAHPLTESWAPPPHTPTEHSSGALAIALRQDVAELSAQVHQQSGSPLAFSRRLCETFIHELVRERRGILPQQSFQQLLEQELRHALETDGDGTRLQLELSALRCVIGPRLEDFPAELSKAENIWHEARTRCSALAQRYHVQRRLQSEFWFHSMQEGGARLLRCHSWSSLVDTAARELPDLGITTCYLCTTNDGNANCLRFAMEKGTVLDVSGIEPFPAEWLLPASLASGATRLIAYSLYDESCAFGHVVFALEQLDTSGYELLRDYLTGAVRGLLDRDPPMNTGKAPR